MFLWVLIMVCRGCIKNGKDQLVDAEKRAVHKITDVILINSQVLLNGLMRKEQYRKKYEP